MSPAKEPTPALHLRWRLGLMAAALAVFGLFHLLSQVPVVTEVLYGSSLGPVVAWSLSRLSGMIPFSLLEVVVLAFVLRHLVAVGLDALSAVRGRASKRRVLAAGGLRLGADLAVAALAFYFLWGFHYARPPLDERLGLPEGGDGRLEEVAHLAQEMVTATNRTYFELHGSDDLGEPTPVPVAPARLQNALDEGWARITRDLDLPGHYAWRHGGMKPFLLSSRVKWLGISGIYFPFTGEALILDDLPAVTYGKVMAHETAHQRGIAEESDANFMGFLAASRSPSPALRYAAYAFAQRQLMSTLAISDADRWRELRARRLPGVQRDLDELSRYWNPSTGPLAEWGSRVNDVMLRSHGVQTGVFSYSESMQLLVAYARHSGWSLVAPAFRADLAPVTSGGGWGSGAVD